MVAAVVVPRVAVLAVPVETVAVAAVLRVVVPVPVAVVLRVAAVVVVPPLLPVAVASAARRAVSESEVSLVALARRVLQFTVQVSPRGLQLLLLVSLWRAPSVHRWLLPVWARRWPRLWILQLLYLLRLGLRTLLWRHAFCFWAGTTRPF